MGLSPPARGAHLSPFRGWRGERIIPACAGSTRPVSARQLRGPDHPRLRGEHHRQHWATARSPGIIPACAGSTGARRRRLLCGVDHPRLRGEHCNEWLDNNCCGGSSPPARGAQSLRNLVTGLAGIIPACAGSTTRRSSSERVQEDHPRLRGEHNRSRISSMRRSGSSPPARGARYGDRDLRRDLGIIPACAGSTSRLGAIMRTGEDHPRLRGEHLAEQEADIVVGGSSPPARGARGA